MSIRKVQCVNGHFFDGNKYDACPLCKAPEKKEPEPTHNNKLNQNFEKPEKTDGGADKGNMFDFLHRKKKNDDINIPDDKTVGLGDVVKAPVVQKQKAEEPKREEPVKQADVVRPAPSLSMQVEQKANTIDAKTTGRYTTEEAEPVVGWLVAVSGDSQGLSFELNDGKNSIGRMRTNKVALEKETSVSREKHAYIVFDSKNNAFYIQSGESDKMTYLNDSPVLTPQQLNAYDKLQLGDCELVFVPLCGDKFNWDSYIK